MHELITDRRRFLTAVIALAGTAEALRLGRAWAQNATASDVSDAMARIARRLYPHDGLTDAFYAGILDDAMSAAAGDPDFAATLADAEQALNAQQTADFMDLDESGQIAALEAVQQAPFFTAIQTAVRLRLYNHPAFWALIGYDGPSWQFGGYLNNGAGEIDWLPEGE
jgi:hypothetical protein